MFTISSEKSKKSCFCIFFVLFWNQLIESYPTDARFILNFICFGKLIPSYNYIYYVIVLFVIKKILTAYPSDSECVESEYKQIISFEFFFPESKIQKHAFLNNKQTILSQLIVLIYVVAAFEDLSEYTGK